MASIVDDSGEEFFAAACHYGDGFFGGTVFSWARKVVGGVVGRGVGGDGRGVGGLGCGVVGGGGGVVEAGSAVEVHALARKDVGDRGEAVHVLLLGVVRVLREVGRRPVPAGKGLV